MYPRRLVNPHQTRALQCASQDVRRTGPRASASLCRCASRGRCVARGNKGPIDVRMDATRDACSVTPAGLSDHDACSDVDGQARRVNQGPRSSSRNRTVRYVAMQRNGSCIALDLFDLTQNWLHSLRLPLQRKNFTALRSRV